MKHLLVVVLVIIVSLSVVTSSVFAANACVNVSGNSGKTKTITIETGKSWLGEKITFTQNKGEIIYRNNRMGDNKVSTYGAYTIQVSSKAKNGNTNISIYKWRYTKNFSIKLEKNTKYSIDVIPYSVNTIGKYLRQNDWKVKLNTAHIISESYKWKTNSIWRVKSTRAVASCNAK